MKPKKTTAEVQAICCLPRIFSLALFLVLAASHGEIAAGWQEEWQATVQAAKREGQVTVYISGYGATLDAGHFQKDFPEIKLVAVTGQSGQLGPRILAERRAGKYLADISSAGANPHYQLFYASKILEPISSALILPEVTDQSKWWGGKHWYIDPEGQYIFVYVGNMTGTGAYAVNALNPAEFKSYWDFVNPKWKGKIVARDIRIAGPGGDNMRFFYHHPGLGPKFIHRLFSEMDLTLTRDFRQGIDWLGQGKFPLAIFFSNSDVKMAGRQGLPVDVIDNSSFKEGVPMGVGFGTLSLFKNAPHPNAAKVFINWYLSRKAQIALQKDMTKIADAPDSLRIDIPKDDVAPDNRRIEGVNYMTVFRSEWTDMTPIYAVVNEALAEAEKKKSGK
ncbi:MAG: extracellular solute-binding protein [Deltaproteobacteria bacterium]|nr:MAG: extracellular solute-binding protein [Deltaproteobacteria bacterium]